MMYGKPCCLLLFLSLLGCNSDTSDNLTTENLIPSQQHLHALNGIGAVEVNKTEQIDLTNFIIKNTSEHVEITHIDNLNLNRCPDIAPSNLGFNIYSDTLGRCDYRFHVINSAGEKDSAIYSVLTSNEALATVKTLNFTTGLNTEFTLDLLRELSLSDYEINLDSFKTQFSPTMASSDSQLEFKILENGQIQLNTPSEIGWFYISYTLRPTTENGVVQPDAKAGYIFINITNNEAPIISKPQCYIKENVDKNAKIDLALLKDTIGETVISHKAEDGEENQEWQLSYVFSPTTNKIYSNDPDNVTNKKILLNKPDEGTHEIIYTISDHENGFALGLMEIKVVEKNGDSDSLTCK